MGCVTEGIPVNRFDGELTTGVDGGKKVKLVVAVGVVLGGAGSDISIRLATGFGLGGSTFVSTLGAGFSSSKVRSVDGGLGVS